MKTSDLKGVLDIARLNFMRAADRLHLQKELRDKLAVPKERIELSFSPIMTSGEILHTSAFVVRHSDTLGPAKGGIRMADSVTMDEVNGLAMEMTWKTALMGIPFGGGKSGIACDPATLSGDDHEIVIRSFCRAARRHIGPEIYVPAPDMGTGEKDMGHIRDCISYSDGTSITRGCFVTGKPVILGGIVGRREATGKGVVYTILAACRKLGLDHHALRVVVQGFGNVGSVAARAIAAEGATVVAVADLSGGLFNDAGLDVEALAKHVDERGSIAGFPGGTPIAGSAIFEIECDCLIPAAGAAQITAENAPNLKARLVAEGANAPTTPDADEILKERGVFVIPDILCNGGGVFVSYLEYAQETQHEQMTLAQVEERLKDRMESCFSDVSEYADMNHCSMREAAMDIAVGRVVTGLTARGVHP